MAKDEVARVRAQLAALGIEVPDAPPVVPVRQRGGRGAGDSGPDASPRRGPARPRRGARGAVGDDPYSAPIGGSGGDQDPYPPFGAPDPGGDDAFNADGRSAGSRRRSRGGPRPEDDDSLAPPFGGPSDGGGLSASFRRRSRGGHAPRDPSDAAFSGSGGHRGQDPNPPFGGPPTDGSPRRSRGGSRRDDRNPAGGPGRRGPAPIDPDADPEAAARAICLRLLTGQPRTRAQLADALARREVPDEVAEHVLGRFAEVKLIDDAAFADAWVESRHAGRGLARRALARELRVRGVDAALVSEAVGRLDPEQEAETARALVARRLPATRGLDRQVRIRRLAGMLARKGYAEGLALRVVREALDAEGETDAGE